MTVVTHVTAMTHVTLVISTHMYDSRAHDNCDICDSRDITQIITDLFTPTHIIIKDLVRIKFNGTLPFLIGHHFVM